MTEYLGFSAYTGEGKVMGLAPYGKPNLSIKRVLEKFLKIEKGFYKINPEYVYFGQRSFSLKHTDKLVLDLCKKPRVPESEINNFYCDVAF